MPQNKRLPYEVKRAIKLVKKNEQTTIKKKKAYYKVGKYLQKHEIEGIGRDTKRAAKRTYQYYKKNNKDFQEGDYTPRELRKMT